MLSIDKVIEAYHISQESSEVLFSIFTLIIWFGIGILVIFHFIKDRKAIKLKGYFLRFLFLLVVLVININLLNYISNHDFSMDEEKWRTEYFDPYIDTQSINKVEVKDFSQIIDGELEGITSVYIKEEIKPQWFRINTSDGKEYNIQSIIKKENIDKPYLTFKTIEKKISGKYNKDSYYETVLHIPNDYRVIETYQ